MGLYNKDKLIPNDIYNLNKGIPHNVKQFKALVNSFNKELNKRIVSYLGKNIDSADKYLAIIREQLEEMIVGLNNPFATEIIRALSEVIKKMPRKVSKIQKGITDRSSDALGIATKGINGYNI